MEERGKGLEAANAEDREGTTSRAQAPSADTPDAKNAHGRPSLSNKKGGGARPFPSA